jgi:hypothetical protein
MGWVNVCRRDGLKLDELYKIKDETCIGKLHPYIGLLLYPCIPLTTKHMQSIGWELVASTNRTDNCSAGFDVIYYDNNEDLMD